MYKQCKKASLSGMMVTLWVAHLFAQGPDTLWTRTYGGDSADVGHSVQQTSDGGYIIAGYTHSFGAGKSDVYLIKTDAIGDSLWTKIYGGPYSDEGCSVQQTSDGGYIIAGYTQSFGAGYTDVYLIKTNTNGDTLWTKTYGGEGNDWGRSVQETSEGGYIIAGYTRSFGAGYTDVYLIRTDAIGDSLWTKIYGEPYSDEGCSVQQTSDGGYIIAGYTFSFSAGPEDVYLIKTNTNGDTLWTKTYGGEGSDRGWSVQETSDGGYIVVGYTWSFGTGNQDVYLIKTDTKGGILWAKTYGGTLYDKGYSVQQTSDGGYIIAGWTNSFSKGIDAYLIKTKPPLTLTSPNGGEVLVSNTIHHITWIPEGTDFDSYRLLYSLDGGESYPYIIADRISPNSGLYSWKVPEIECNTCRIKIQIRDMKGKVTEDDESDSNFTIQSTGIEEEESLPKAFFVSSIEPSQADRTLVKYGLPKSSNVHIVIYNLLGQEIRALANKKENAGIHTIIWDGRDNSGKKLSSGIYFLRFEAEGYKATRKLLMMR